LILWISLNNGRQDKDTTNNSKKIAMASFKVAPGFFISLDLGMLKKFKMAVL